MDHYMCYKSFVTPGTPRLQRNLRISVSDAFTSTPKTFALNKPAHLCIPADAQSQGFVDRKILFLCYAARPAQGQPRHVPQLGIHLNDEFGTETLNTVKELEICIPSVRLTP
jgi:hypothetical protein